MEVNNSAQPANLQELTLESGVCYWWNFGLDSIDQKPHREMVNLPSAQGARGRIMLCFCDYRGVLPVNWDSNDSHKGIGSLAHISKVRFESIVIGVTDCLLSGVFPTV